MSLSADELRGLFAELAEPLPSEQLTEETRNRIRVSSEHDDTFFSAEAAAAAINRVHVASDDAQPVGDIDLEQVFSASNVEKTIKAMDAERKRARRHRDSSHPSQFIDK